MPLPQFDGTGLLPAFIGSDATTADRSPYIVSMPELVVRFGTSPERRQLLRNLIEYRKVIASGGYDTGIQFIDGSFVEDIENIKGRPPRDIDIYSLLGMPEKYKNDKAFWISEGMAYWSGEIAHRNKNKNRYQLDTYGDIIDTLPVPNFITRVIYWYGLFSHQRDTNTWKGFAALPLSPTSDAAGEVELDRFDAPGAFGQAGGP